jgi:hypothetical protein
MSIKSGIFQSEADRLIASLPKETLFNTCIADSNQRNKSYVDFIIVTICFDMLVRLYWTFFFHVDKSFNIYRVILFIEAINVCVNRKRQMKS